MPGLVSIGQNICAFNTTTNVLEVQVVHYFLTQRPEEPFEGLIGIQYTQFYRKIEKTLFARQTTIDLI